MDTLNGGSGYSCAICNQIQGSIVQAIFKPALKGFRSLEHADGI